MGDRFFSMQQFGKETTHGTAVAATRKIIGGIVGPVTPDRKPRTVPENVGVRAEGTRKVVDQYQVKESLSIKEGYFQALPMIFGCGLKGAVTPSEVTPSQSDYLWDFTPSMAFGVLNAPDSITLEKGDDTQAFETSYVMFERIKISGQVAQGAEDAPVAIESEYFGRVWTPTTFTGSIAIPAVAPMNAKLARLYLNTAWASVGNTELANILRSFEIDILTGVHAAFSGSGAKDFNKHKEGVIGAMLTLTIEGDSDADAIFDAFHTDPQTLQVARLAINGSQIGSGTNHSLIVDIGGMWEEVVPLGEEDRGNNLHTCVLGGLYDPTGAKLLSVKTTTNQSTY